MSYARLVNREEALHVFVLIPTKRPLRFRGICGMDLWKSMKVA